jgi:hypothetical protein
MVDRFILIGDLRVELRYVVVVERQSGMNFRHGEMRMLFVNGVGAPPVSKVVEHHFDDFHILAVNPSYASVVADNVRNGFSRRHGPILTLAAWLRNQTADSRLTAPHPLEPQVIGGKSVSNPHPRAGAENRISDMKLIPLLHAVLLAHDFHVRAFLHNE